MIHYIENDFLKIGVNEIGCECGFSSPSYFSKVVKAKTGLTPKKFREQG